MNHAPDQSQSSRRSMATRMTGGPGARGTLTALAAILVALLLLPGTGGAASPAAAPAARPRGRGASLWLGRETGGHPPPARPPRLGVAGWATPQGGGGGRGCHA